MRTSKCKTCGEDWHENDFNPNVHYSSPSDVCDRCNTYNKAPVGTWFQDKEGNFFQKIINNKEKL